MGFWILRQPRLGLYMRKHVPSRLAMIQPPIPEVTIFDSIRSWGQLTGYRSGLHLGWWGMVRIKVLPICRWSRNRSSNALRPSIAWRMDELLKEWRYAGAMCECIVWLPMLGVLTPQQKRKSIVIGDHHETPLKREIPRQKQGCQGTTSSNASAWPCWTVEFPYPLLKSHSYGTSLCWQLCESSIHEPVSIAMLVCQRVFTRIYWRCALYPKDRKWSPLSHSHVLAAVDGQLPEYWWLNRAHGAVFYTQEQF